MHEVLFNRLGDLSLPRQSVVWFTDRPDMTLDVYRGRKTTMQQQMIANLDWDPWWHDDERTSTNNDLQNHIWTRCNPCVNISAPINTEYQRPHPSIYGSVSKTDIGTFPSAETVE